MTFDIKPHTIEDLKKLVEERFYSYYPEFSSENIHVKGRLLKRCHQSLVYRFDVHNTKGVLKSLIVKKRIYNKSYNNHIIENTKKEFAILTRLNSLSKANVLAPRALDAMPDEALLVTEEVKGETIYSYLSRTSYLLSPSGSHCGMHLPPLLSQWFLLVQHLNGTSLPSSPFLLLHTPVARSVLRFGLYGLSLNFSSSGQEASPQSQVSGIHCPSRL